MPRPSPAGKSWLALYSELIGAWRHRRGLREDAEDATQDVALRMLENGVGAIEEPGAYLQRGICNRLVSLHRARAVRAAVPLDALADGCHPPAASAEEVCSARQLADALVDALGRLPPACQEVFRLHRLEGWTQDRIAAHLGISRNMVERHMMRAMRHLQEMLPN